MSVQYPKLQRMFDNDSKLMIETLRRLLARVEPGELAETDVDRAFRAAHSIKSEAGFLNQEGIASVAHQLEDALSAVRDAGGAVNDSAARDLRDGYAALSLALSAYAKRNEHRSSQDDDSQELERERAEQATPTSLPVATPPSSAGRHSGASRTAALSLPELAGTSQAEEGMIREALRRGERLFRIRLRLQNADLNYARAFLVVNNLELSAAVIRTEPALEDFAASGRNELTAFVTTGSDELVLRRAVHVDEVELAEMSELSLRDVKPEPGTRARAEGDEQSREESALLAEEIAVLADRIRRDGKDSQTTLLAQRIRSYAEVFGERAGREARIDLSGMLRELRDRSVSYAQKQGKRVRITIGGSGALVAPAVADTLLEALLHLLRNSIDHGIETIERRAKKGRHPAATIAVRVDGIGDRVRVVVQDDGTGIDEQAVRRRGGEGELIEVLARAGISTRAEADEGSGRGVGLNTVVYSVRTLLGGTIQLKNQPGRGATFVIAVPVVSRLIRVLHVRYGRSLFAVPAATVLSRGTLEPRRIRRDSFGALYYDVDGIALPMTLVNGKTPSEKRLSNESVCLIARGGAATHVIVVDSVDGEEAIARDREKPELVHSRVHGRTVSFVYPGAFEA